MFNLTRYFSVLSFVLIVLVGGILGRLQREGEVARLIDIAEDRNEAMTEMFRNAMWPDFADLAMENLPLTSEALLSHIVEHDVLRKVTTLMRDSDIIKVKVYNLAGMTVFSSDLRQVGEDKRNNQGYISARAGHIASELVHRNQFDSFEGTITDIDVISSYVPVRDHDSRELIGVMEVYQDVTPFIKQLNEAMWQTWLTVVGLLGALYLMQLLVVHHAQIVLRRQEDALQEANRELDRRVQERTAELQAEVSERRNAEARLDHLAHHDPLTGLPNRLMFGERLRRSIALAARHDRKLAVMFIDLDRFKEVNDTLGHSVGDGLLIDVTHRLTSRLRGGDTLARLGGDEFVCILEEVGGPAEAEAAAASLIALLVEPFRVLEHELYIAASIGICIYPADGEDVDTLVRNADTAMYEAKAQGRGRSHFYTPELTAYAQERIRIETLLRRAIETDELNVHYQMKVDLLGRPTGCEALLRWNSAELGQVSPVRFIPMAEETGFIVELGEWVLRQACTQLVKWRAAGISVPKVSVNLSVKQIERSDVVELVRQVLSDTGLSPESLELEITESAIMNTENALQVLKRLSDLGIKLAVDDFGTGYSSLAYLKLLPIDTLKIDRSFIVGINGSSGDEAIIRAIMALARSLGFSTVAEGVDSERQLGFLESQGCDEIQGYYFARPQAAESFASEWRARST